MKKNYNFTGTDLLLTPPSEQGFPIGIFEFHLKWKKEFRETEASVTLKISNNATATIQIVKPRDAILVQNRLYINKNQIFHLHAENIPINSTTAWSVHKNKDSTNIMDQFAEYLLTETNSTDLIMKAVIFEEGVDYMFQLRITRNDIDSSETSINVALPISPKGGYLSVEPCNSGARAFHTNFHIDARDWMLIGKEDSNMQLEYYFGYTVDGTTVYLSATYSTANEVGTTPVCNKSWVSNEKVLSSEYEM